MGIQRHYTAPYSPQQNGVAERRNRTVAAMARSLLKEKGMPLVFWGEAVWHAVYILNRLPTRALSKQTPYEAWKGKRPNLDHLRIFGCVGHMKTPGIHARKLDDRSKPVVYLGKEAGTKAYRVFDPVGDKVHVSRDIVFEEYKKWPWDGEENNDARVSKVTGNFTVFDVEGDTPSYDTDEGNQIQSPLHDSQSGSMSSLGSENEGGYSSEASSSSSSEPRRYRSISNIYNTTEEIEAVEEELLLVEVDEPSNMSKQQKKKCHKAIGLKWVFKAKKDTNGKVIKHKARLVAKGYVQKFGVDFQDVFIPVTRMESVRLLLGIAANNEWEVHHLDMKLAFLNGVLLEEVYVARSQGFERAGEEKKFYKLFKALYGLRKHPVLVYIKREGSDVLIIGVIVDDLLITGTRVDSIANFKKQMNKEFDMSDMGQLAYYIGIEVEQGQGYIEIKQSAYAKKILERAGMAGCKPVSYPMDPRLWIKGTLNYGLVYTKSRGDYLLTGLWRQC
ncbi:hypothetical protein AgCh_010629 [Apium graveolens]